MANNVFGFIIKARDQASGILGRINSAISGLGGSANKASAQAGSLTDEIAGGIVKAQLLGAAFNAVGQSVSFVQNKLMESARLQTENIQNIGTLASLTNLSFDQATEFVERLNVRIAEMGKALPVAAQDIKTVAGAIQDDLIEAFKTANGVNFKGLESALVNISSDFAVLGKSAQVAAQDVQMGLARFLGGASTAEYEQLNLFQRNNALRNELRRQLGGRQSKDLTIQERVQVLQRAGAKLNTPETKRRLAGSIEGLISNFQDSLFDPDTGIFGFMKDLDLRTKGTQSVTTSFNAALEQVIGENGVFNNLGRLLQAAGVHLADPMKVLKSGIDSFTAGVAKVNEALGAAREFFSMGNSPLQVVTSLLSYFDADKNLAKFFNSLVIFIDKGFDLLVNSIQTLADSIDPKVLNESVMGAIATAVSAIAYVISTLDWVGLLTASLSLLDKIMQSNLPLILSVAGVLGTAAINATALALAALVPLITPPGITLLLVAAAFSIAYWIGTKLLEWWNNEGQSSFSKWWKATSNQLVTDWNNFWGRVTQMLLDMVNFVGDWWDKTIGAAQKKLGKVLADPIAQVTPEPVKQAAGIVFSPGLQNLIPGVGLYNTTRGLYGLVSGAKYNGQIPNAADGFLGGLMQAAAAESRAMPSGSGLVVGNTSEFILRPDQMKRLMQGAASVGTSSTQINFSPTFNIQGASDPRALAQMALNELDAMLQDYVVGQLA